MAYMAFPYMMKMINSGSNPSRLFLGTSRPLNSLDPNPDLNPKHIKNTNRVQIPNAINHHHPSSYVASFAAFAMLTRGVAVDLLTVGKELRSLADEFIPREYQDYYIHEMKKMILKNDNEFTIVVDKYQAQSNIPDQMFKAVETYLATKVNESSVRKINVCKNKESLAITLDKNEEIYDEFNGVQVNWRLGLKCYELTFHNRHRVMILDSYLPYILDKSDTIKSQESGLKLHMVDDNYPEPKTVILDNPMTFKTLAIEPELKESIIEDLNNFKDGKEYYRRIGKAWKRGYLIYGPSGTGKSSLISSIANYLNYDIYDIDLTDITSDLRLKNILLQIPNKSILVFEDFDECHDLTHEVSRKSTFSRLLNFLDGIWSCSGEERVFIFSTKCADKVDPTLLRPGRMDMHIHMPYCTYSAFKQLASNYLELEDHKLFERVKHLLQNVKVTPAEVAGELMKCTKDSTICLERLIAYLESKTGL